MRTLKLANKQGRRSTIHLIGKKTADKDGRINRNIFGERMEIQQNTLEGKQACRRIFAVAGGFLPDR
jgi:hypothetical protein